MALDNNTNMSLTRTAVKAELLDAETELQLAYAWRDSRDEAALHRLITAYMRLAISMAAKFKRYGAPMNDLVQEAGLGLMKAADKFDPDRGVRFSTYAVWWIKASVPIMLCAIGLWFEPGQPVVKSHYSLICGAFKHSLREKLSKLEKT